MARGTRLVRRLHLKGDRYDDKVLDPYSLRTPRAPKTLISRDPRPGSLGPPRERVDSDTKTTQNPFCHCNGVPPVGPQCSPKHQVGSRPRTGLPGNSFPEDETC